MDEERLIRELRLIQSIFSGTSVQGEKEADERALDRIRRQLRDHEKDVPVMELKFSVTEFWSRCVLLALLRRYGIAPYRYRGQRRTTVMITAPTTFAEEILLPEVKELSRILAEHLAEVTHRIVKQVIHHDYAEIKIREKPTALGKASTKTEAPGTEPSLTNTRPGNKQGNQPIKRSGTSRISARKKRRKKKRRR